MIFLRGKTSCGQNRPARPLYFLDTGVTNEDQSQYDCTFIVSTNFDLAKQRPVGRDHSVRSASATRIFPLHSCRKSQWSKAKLEVCRSQAGCFSLSHGPIWICCHSPADRGVVTHPLFWHGPLRNWWTRTMCHSREPERTSKGISQLPPSGST